MIPVSREFLIAMKQYIEDSETSMDVEWGCRSLKQLMADGAMPDEYDKILELLEAPEG